MSECSHDDALKAIISRQAFHWGDDVRESYHLHAEQDMDRQWRDIIAPVLQRHPIDYTVTVDLACGHGRNSLKLAERAGRVIMVDVNPENTFVCREKFPEPRFCVMLTNGYDLRGITDGAATFVYCFDAMVQFDIAIVHAYLAEILRVLSAGGYAFLHHANFLQGFATDFREVPTWRNFLTREIFAGMCRRMGFEVCEQTTIDWGTHRDHDCLSVIRKPAGAALANVDAVLSADRFWLDVLATVRDESIRSVRAAAQPRSSVSAS